MKRPAVFFDRDNTLIASDGYLGDPAKVALIPGAAEAIARVRGLGYAVVVFSNQSGVARGMFTEEDVQAVNARMAELLLAENGAAVIDRHEFCPFHPEAEVERYRQDSDLRKPKPGMIFQAERQLALDLSRSWVVGDAPRDIDAGHAGGCRTVLVKNGALTESPAAREPGEHAPDFEVESLREAMEVIARNRMTEDSPAEEAPPQPIAPSEPEPEAAQPESSEPEPAPQAAEPEPEREPERPREPEPVTHEGSVETSYPVEEKPVETAAEAPAAAVAPRVQRSEPEPLTEPVVTPPVVDEEKDESHSEPEPEPEPARPFTPPAPAAVEAPATTAVDDAENESPAPGAAASQRGKSRSEILLGQILDELRRRHEQPEADFSVSKLMAGVVQVLALAALFLAYIKPNLAGQWLLTANFLQTFTIALLIMGRQK
jgi:D-glycero-D-manno-heptose 1,7-bisphosphate phosphatase